MLTARNSMPCPVTIEAFKGKQGPCFERHQADRKSTRLNSSHDQMSYAVFCFKKKIAIIAGPVKDRHLSDRFADRGNVEVGHDVVSAYLLLVARKRNSL